MDALDPESTRGDDPAGVPGRRSTGKVRRERAGGRPLVVVPVVYSLLDDFGAWARRRIKRWTSAPEQREPVAAD